MTDPRDEFLPYWLRTATPSGANGGLLDSLTRPPDEPWNDPRPMTFAQTPWGAMTPPPSLFGQSPTFPPSPPPSSWGSSSASLWHTPFGANAGFPAPTAQPVLEPWNDPRSAIFAQTPWVPMTPPPPFVPPSAFPSALPHSALKTRVNALLEHLDSGKYWPVAPAPSGANEQPPSHGFYFPPVPQASSWDQVPTYSADSATPGLPQPPYWDSAASPVEHPDSAKYWGAPAASHSASKTRVNALLSGASTRPPTTSPTWLPTAEWKAPEAAPRLSFSGPDYAPRTDHTSDHLWVTESSAPTVPRALVPADLGRRSRDAENALAFARLFAPDLVNYLTTPAPPPQYTPNAAGKISPIGYHPGENAAGVDLFANLATGFIPGGSAAKLAMAPILPAAAKAARQLATPGLAMTKAARHARAVEHGFTPGFWRGESTGAAPNEYPRGGWFSLDRKVAAGHAERGGVKERPFWLQLENVWQDSMPMTADKYGRVVEAARQVDPKLALDLAEQVAPRKSVDWVIGFGKAQPDFVMPIAPAP